MRILASLLAILLLLVAATPAHALSVENIRFGQHPDKIRMVIELSAPAAFRAVAVDGTPRLLIDLPDYEWRAGDVPLRQVPQVRSLRTGALQPGINRLVVELARPAAMINAFTIPATGNLPHRLVIDFKPGGTPDPARLFGTLRAADPAGAQIPPSARATTSNQILGTLPVTTATTPRAAAREPAYNHIPARTAPLPGTTRDAAPEIPLPGRKPVLNASAAGTPPVTPPSVAAPAATRRGQKHIIVIDAGHGGADPGAIGASGILEKNITLAMARELKTMLEQTGRYTVHLTRDTDKFLRLHQRVSFARQKNADLFISLHADAIGKDNVRGASIYTLSETASDRETAELAERENKADLIAGADLSHADKDIAQILVGMAMRDTMNQSKFFANNVVSNLRGDGLRLLERPHRFAGFAVLKAPDIPSVLIEIGFMSNANEVRELNTPAHRQKLGAALVRSIDGYFEKVARNSRT